MSKIFLLLFCVLLSSCSGYKLLPIQTTITMRDSVVMKTDTLKIEVEKKVLQTIIKTDTAFMHDTISVQNEDSTMLLRYWRTKHHELEAICTQLKRTKKISIDEKTIYRTITQVETKIVEVEKKYVPFYLWAILTGLTIALFLSLVKIRL